MRSRRCVAAGCWTVGFALVAVALADRVFAFQIGTGLAVRPVSVAELTLAMAACSLPALTWPQLWTWERTGCRLVVRVVSGSLVPSLVGLLALVPVVSARPAAPAEVIAANVLLCAAVATLAVIGIGRQAGPALGFACYLAGIATQALEMPVPLPLPAQAGASAWQLLVALGCLAVIAGGCAVSLGSSAWGRD
ncbi:hypothetical protein [Nocardioides nitrophenolicus]|uniref:hypothetical protein n=1 Tax=Nocardioides nitrophenolicus TaxID=60489 RepID=UPI00195A2525|nr:hypothetical protein [Nocardioides nitrophenolicus]MBM7520127.1 hypothetical protein [Nocardioides nitrophenolicus]